MTAVDELLDVDLVHAEVVLLKLGLFSRDRLGALGPARHAQFNLGLRTCLLALGAQSPARRDLKSVATSGGPGHLSGRGGKDASRGAASRPVQLRAGRPPLPGTGFALPEALGLPSFEALLNP